MLERAVAFVKERKSGGRAIGDYQAVSHELANLRAKLEAARLLTYQSAWKLGTNERTGLDASITKLIVSETFKEFALKIFQIYAGHAYKNNHEAERFLRDAMGSTLYSGTSEVQRNIIAKNMGM